MLISVINPAISYFLPIEVYRNNIFNGKLAYVEHRLAVEPLI